MSLMTGILVGLAYKFQDIILAESSTYVEVGGSGGLDSFGQTMEDTPLTYKKKSSGSTVAL